MALPMAVGQRGEFEPGGEPFPGRDGDWLLDHWTKEADSGAN